MYTWGQFRFQLQTWGPGASMDLLDEFLNTRYAQILDHYPWGGLRASAIVGTAAAYQSGTVATTAGSATVNGTGTAWTGAIAGRKFFIPGDNAIYTATYVSPAQLTLDRNYEGGSGGVLSYVLMANVYPLPADVKTVTEVLDAVSGLPLARLDEVELDASAGPRSRVNDPQAYAITDDSSEAAPPVLHQIEFYPPPLTARGYTVRYRRAAFGFTGSNTSNGPLPWVSDACLLFGCRADIMAWQKDYKGAEVFEVKFAAQLAAMVREDALRNPPPAIKMASRFARHRMKRVLRGYWNNWGPGQGGPD